MRLLATQSSEEQYLTLLSGLLESYATPIAAAHSKNATAAALVTSLQGLIASNTDLLAGMNAGAATGQLCQVFCDRIGGALTLHVQYAERFHDFATMLVRSPAHAPNALPTASSSHRSYSHCPRRKHPWTPPSCTASTATR